MVLWRGCKDWKDGCNEVGVRELGTEAKTSRPGGNVRSYADSCYEFVIAVLSDLRILARFYMQK